MPPRVRGRGGAAPQRDPAPAPTLRSSFAALPSLVEHLLLAARSGRKPAASAEEALNRLVQQLSALPDFSPPHAAELAELLSTNPEATAALLRLHAAALRPGGEGISGDRVGTGAAGRGSAAGGGRNGGSGAAWVARWRRLALDAGTLPLFICAPLPASCHALCMLRFARGMLRAQALHVLSRNMAAAAAALDCAVGSGGGSGGGGGGGGRAGAIMAATAPAVWPARVALAHCLMHLISANRVLLDDTAYGELLFQGEGESARALPLTGLAAEVAAARAAAVEEYARALAESGILEHTARLLLQLQALGPQAVEPVEGSQETLPRAVMNALFHITWHGFAGERDGFRGVTSPDVVSACPRAVSPPPPPCCARRSAAGSGVGSATRLAVAALQTGRRLLPAASPGAAAAGSGPAAETVQWAAQRSDWWRLAVSMLVYGMSGLLQLEGGQLLRNVYDMMAEALAGVWPERRLDLDALPAEAPPEVAAALAGGLLRGLTMIGTVIVGSRDPFHRPAITELLAACNKAGAGPGPGPGPAGGGLALVLVPLLAYSERAEAEPMLQALGLMAGLCGPLQAQLWWGPMGWPLGCLAAAAGALDAGVVKRATTGFLGTVSLALRHCRRPAAAAAGPRGIPGCVPAANPATVSSTTPAVAHAAAAASTASAASDVPLPGPLRRLSRRVAAASELWDLPLP
ncbi:hypothetical protein HYH03_016950 [Edaphochlamys debaryana]|uniref:Uncharacterized protein n=1 Tax=Edaphochlamys debaryana TaxID=47281 RepID=A0A835XIV8_9CHLO|nr:hypothetical protein HYH03_016950 [Edaphochlamys debaryana]|eukprot:KAG2484215.1 hypothetical protein HYH03_016950 [Edaphochlamys debaryana]